MTDPGGLVRRCEQAHCTVAGAEVAETCKGYSAAILITKDAFGPCYCACSCLVFGTPVQTGGGAFKAIETFEVGEQVMAAGKDLRWSQQPVVYSGGTGSATTQSFMVLVTYMDTAIVTTSDHLFLLAGDEPRLRRADRLTTGDVLVAPNGDPVPVTGLHIGDYTAGIHHVVAMSKEPPSGDLDGHLLNTNGVVSADYAVQLLAQSGNDVPGFSASAEADLPIVGSTEYVAEFGPASLAAPALPRAPVSLHSVGSVVDQGTQYLTGLLGSFVPAGSDAVQVPAGASGYLTREQAEARKSAPKRPFNDPVTREMVKHLIQQHQLHYPDITFHADWSDDDVNAYAWTDHGTRHVALKSGLARDSQLGLEGVALVLAERVAHHYYANPSPDYHAVRDVMRNVWYGEQYITMTDKGIDQLSNVLGKADQARLDAYRAAVDLTGAPA